MRRIWIVLVAFVMALAIASPATAKRPVPEPTLYDVTLSLTGSQGLASCDGSPLVMRGANGALIADGDEGTSVPRLLLNAEVPWSRTDPEPASGTRFEGCHGGALEGSESDIPSYFVVHLDRQDHIVGVLWAFDVYVENGTKGKNKVPDVKEYFRLWSSEGASFDGSCLLDPTEPTTCNISGNFEVWHYYPIEQIGNPDFDFTLTITPN